MISHVDEMATAENNVFGFGRITLLKAQSLGIGSYGAVCKAKCDDLLCAAKLLHPILFDPTTRALASRQTEHRLPISRFEQECKVLSSMKHPNIIQYLGTCQDPENGLPVLLMELMDESLTSFLERSQQDLPYHVEISISNDIALALSFLHSNGIIHRDLSSNNVLMIGNSRAKVTDFGMARLAGISCQAARISLIQTPSTDVYKPQEAVQIAPLCGEKMDCFSYGVLAIQIMTRQFPNPGDWLKVVQINDPNFPSGSVRIAVPEVERRQEHISLINQTHPLLAVALDCLKDEEGERPSAQEICGRLVALKQASQFTQSVQEQATPQQTTAHEGAVRELQQELKQLRQQVRENERMTAEFQQASVRDERRIRELEQHQSTQPVIAEAVQVREQKLKCQSTASSSGGAEGPVNIVLKWREGKKALHILKRESDPVVHGNAVYLRLQGTRQVHSYDSTTNDWFQLPDCPHKYSSLAVVENLLTAIGGGLSCQPTNKLLSLTVEGRDKKWMQKFPPMQTERNYTCAVSSGTALIVIGGLGTGDHVLSSVEVMDVNTKNWTTAASLPEPLSNASVTICGDRIYVLGAYDRSHRSSKAVFTCSLSALLQSCQPKSVAKFDVDVVSLTCSTSVWSKVADLPVKLSTCVTFQGRLLAIGGNGSSFNPTTAVRKYDPATNSWSVISRMAAPRSACLAAVLPEDELIVVGGCTDRFLCGTDSVEVGALM